MELGLDQGPTYRYCARNLSYLASVPRHPQEPAALVVLFLAGYLTHWHFRRLHWTVGYRPNVSQVRAPATERSCSHRSPRKNGATHGGEGPSGTYVLDGGRR